MKEQQIRSARTSLSIAADKAEVWKKVGFYEHVNKQPTWLLRLSLPVPCAVEGRHDRVGDTCRCRYSDGGYLTKRITRIVDDTRIEFEIIEQSIRYQDKVRLLGGCIEVTADGEGRSMVNMVTYYENRFTTKHLTSYCINRVIKAMHRFVIEDMRLHLSAEASAPAQAASCQEGI